MGVMVGGVPIGEPAFVTAVMRAKTAEIVSYIQKTISELRDKPHAAWVALFYSCAPRLDHWLRHMPPSETMVHASVFDLAMLQAAEALGFDGMLSDDITRRRFRLPARMRGCGMRSRAALARTAFSAGFVEAVEAMMGAGDAGLPPLFSQVWSHSSASGRSRGAARASSTSCKAARPLR